MGGPSWNKVTPTYLDNICRLVDVFFNDQDGGGIDTDIVLPCHLFCPSQTDIHISKWQVIFVRESSQLVQSLWGRFKPKELLKIAQSAFSSGWENQEADKGSFQSKVMLKLRWRWRTLRNDGDQEGGKRRIFKGHNLSTVENTRSKNFKSPFTLFLGHFYLEIFHSSITLNIHKRKHTPSNGLSSSVPDFSKRCLDVQARMTWKSPYPYPIFHQGPTESIPSHHLNPNHCHWITEKDSWTQEL